MINFSLIQKIKNKIFPFYKDAELNFVFTKLQEGQLNEYQTARFVGGCVRKYLNGNEIDDIDIATTLTPAQIKEKFKDTKFNVIDTGIKHGTVTLVSNKLKLELTTLRKDIKTDGRHAEIEYTDSWKEDSCRRDFTINAIYLDINGKIFDPQSGKKDLKEHKIRFIGDPHSRIEEDYLRIIRFIRFSLEYESEIDQITIEAIKLNLNGIKKISKERILTELFKILCTKNFIKVNKNKFLRQIFLLIFPEFKYIIRLEKLMRIPHLTFFDNILCLAILLIDEKNNHEYFLHKYNISNNLKEGLNLLAKNFKILQENKKFLQKDIKKNIFYFGKKHIMTLNTLNFSNNNKLKLKEYLNTLSIIEKTSVPKFPFDGNYLKKRGIKEGEVLGRTLKLLENDWIENNFQISEQKIAKIIQDQNY